MSSADFVQRKMQAKRAESLFIRFGLSITDHLSVMTMHHSDPCQMQLHETQCLMLLVPPVPMIGSIVEFNNCKGEFMVAVIVKDDLISKSLKGLLSRAGVDARFFCKYSDSCAVIMEEPDILEALIVDYDINPELCHWLLCGVSRIACQAKILVYSDFPISLPGEHFTNSKLIIKEKPFILRDILDLIASDSRRKNVSL